MIEAYLIVTSQMGHNYFPGFNRSSGDEVFVNFPSTLEDSLKDLGFAGTLGFLRMVHANHLGYLTNVSTKSVVPFLLCYCFWLMKD